MLLLSRGERRWRVLTEAFPMRLHMPLLLTVWAQISCSDYKPLDGASLPPGWMEVPSGYRREVGDPEKVLFGDDGGFGGMDIF